MGWEAITALATLGTGLAIVGTWPPIERAWELLTDVVRIHRTAHGEAFWENFEMLYREGKRREERTRGSEVGRPAKL